MELSLWLIWAILAALFLVGEIFTAGFFLLCFGVGAACAAVTGLLGLGLAWQLGVFVVVSLLGVIVSRRFAERFTAEQPPGIGANRFIGKHCVVLEEINNMENKGRVRMENEEWRARSSNDEIIPSQHRVEVVGLSGTLLMVEPVEKGEH
jgi:membrane protein implicated in regulation of membrane protease activity